MESTDGDAAGADTLSQQINLVTVDSQVVVVVARERRMGG